MKIRSLMTSTVECIRPEATLEQAARRMRDLDVGPLPVCGDNDRLVGMVTDRDITVRSVAEGQNPKAIRVRDVMTPNILYCFDDQDVLEAVRLMKEKKVRRLVVLNRQKRLVGIISLGDLAVETGDDLMAGEALEAISVPSR